MRISIQKEISQKYPNYKLGLVKVIAKNRNLEKLKSLITYDESIADKKSVKEKWLEVFADMNASERRLPSVVALWNIIDRFGELKSINYFVDAYNYISVKHGIPMGGYDLFKLPHDELALQYAIQGGVKFQPMGLAGQFEKIKDRAEVCYYCGDVPVCRYWNNKDSEITKIDEHSSEVLIMFDTLDGFAELEKAMQEWIKLIKETSDVIEIKREILSNEKLTSQI